ncbi:MAG: ORF6N domain-containing protein [Deltaproteobacteria bacterium]|nr:ORF6N domain-containing protein [Deltaproteobacteria bacterium]
MSEDLKSQTVISKPHLRAEDISQHIHIIRGRRVMMDADLAELYGVPTFRLNEAVKRNSARFPEDFMFQLTTEEYTSLISQIAISKPGRGGRRKLPYAFTEQGVAMLSSVLNSDRAIQVNITIMRVFVRIRRLLVSREELARKVEALERKYDSQFRGVFDAIRALMEPPKTPRRRIGF